MTNAYRATLGVGSSPSQLPPSLRNALNNLDSTINKQLNNIDGPMGSILRNVTAAARGAAYNVGAAEANTAATEAQTTSGGSAQAAAQAQSAQQTSQAAMGSVPTSSQASSAALNSNFYGTTVNVNTIISVLGTANTFCNRTNRVLRLNAVGSNGEIGVCNHLRRVQTCRRLIGNESSYDACMAPLIEQATTAIRGQGAVINDVWVLGRRAFIVTYNLCRVLFEEVLRNWPFDRAVQSRMLGDIQYWTSVRIERYQYLFDADAEQLFVGHANWYDKSGRLYQHCKDLRRLAIMLLVAACFLAVAGFWTAVTWEGYNVELLKRVCTMDFTHENSPILHEIRRTASPTRETSAERLLKEKVVERLQGRSCTSESGDELSEVSQVSRPRWIDGADVSVPSSPVSSPVRGAVTSTVDVEVTRDDDSYEAPAVARLSMVHERSDEDLAGWSERGPSRRPSVMRRKSSSWA